MAALTEDSTLKWSFYILSWLGFIGIAVMIFGPFRKLVNDGPNGSSFTMKAVVLSLIWLAYPFVFLLGTEGIQIWSTGVDALLFTVLDLAAKVAYGLWAVGLLMKSSSSSSATHHASRQGA